MHYICLSSFVTSSFASIAIKKHNPAFYAGVFFPGFAAAAILTILSWAVFGECPLSRWENRLRVLEGKAPYKGSCMVYNFNKITGLHINSRLAHGILIGIMLIPVFVFFLE